MVVSLSGSVSCCIGYFLQQWFNLFDPDVAEALYESDVFRRFAGVDLGSATVPGETTLCRFRHLLEKHQMGCAMLDRVNQHLAPKGIRIATGINVDATILHAPSSTKKEKEREPAMRQTRKGQQWYFCLKAHIGMDSKTNVVHSVCTSAALVCDCHMLADLLHGEERKAWGNAGYQGQTRVIQQAAPQARDMTCRKTYNYRVDELQKKKNKTKSKQPKAVFRLANAVMPRLRPAVCSDSTE
jgi:IS5 family transposase